MRKVPFIGYREIFLDLVYFLLQSIENTTSDRFVDAEPDIAAFIRRFTFESLLQDQEFDMFVRNLREHPRILEHQHHPRE